MFAFDLRPKKSGCFYSLFIVSLFLGALFTFVTYRFGVVNQTEDLPKIFRIMDENYLLRDHFVNSSAEHFSIRFFYNHLMAFLSYGFGVELTFFVMTMVHNILILFVSSLVSVQLFNRNYLAGYITIFLILLSPNFYTLAGGYGLLGREVLANFICSIFLYLGILKIFKEEYILGFTLLGIATLFQALSGLLMAFLIFIGFGFKDVLDNLYYKKDVNWSVLLRQYILCALSFLVVSSLILIPYLIYSQGALDSDQFVQIYGYFRIPHHSLPSHFLNDKSLIQSLWFLFTITAVLKLCFFDLDKKDKFWFFIGMLIATFVLLFCGYFFVEVLPTRLFVVLVPFMKLGTIWSWFGILLIAGFMSRFLCTNEKPIFLEVLAWFLITLYFCFYLDFKSLKIVALLFFFTSLVVRLRRWDFNSFYMLISYQVSKFNLFHFAGAIILLVFCLTREPIKSEILKRYELKMNPLFTFIKSETNESSLFIAPVEVADLIRVNSRRAIVAAFKTYPANDKGLLEWYERVIDVYGCGGGDMSGYAITKGYKELTDICINKLKNKYNVNYAVLYDGMDTEYPIVYRYQDQYKIVFLD